MIALHSKRHILASQDAIGQKFLSAFLNFIKKSVVVIRVMVDQDQFLYFGELSTLDGLLAAGVAPTAAVGQFLRSVLRSMEQKVGPRGITRRWQESSPVPCSMQIAVRERDARTFLK